MNCAFCQSELFEHQQAESCPVCGTAHHVECWNVLGGCMNGCGAADQATVAMGAVSAGMLPANFPPVPGMEPAPVQPQPPQPPYPSVPSAYGQPAPPAVPGPPMLPGQSAYGVLQPGDMAPRVQQQPAAWPVQQAQPAPPPYHGAQPPLPDPFGVPQQGVPPPLYADRKSVV